MDDSTNPSMACPSSDEGSKEPKPKFGSKDDLDSDPKVETHQQESSGFGSQDDVGLKDKCSNLLSGDKFDGKNESEPGTTEKSQGSVPDFNKEDCKGKSNSLPAPKKKPSGIWSYFFPANEIDVSKTGIANQEKTDAKLDPGKNPRQVMVLPKQVEPSPVTPDENQPKNLQPMPKVMSPSKCHTGETSGSISGYFFPNNTDSVKVEIKDEIKDLKDMLRNVKREACSGQFKSKLEIRRL